MDEFLRSASHSLVTGALLVIWSGLLLGILWKIVELALATTRAHLPHEVVPVPIREIFLEAPRLANRPAPALGSNNPELLLAGQSQPLLPTPQATPISIPFFHKETTTR